MWVLVVLAAVAADLAAGQIDYDLAECKKPVWYLILSTTYNKCVPFYFLEEFERGGEGGGMGDGWQGLIAAPTVTYGNYARRARDRWERFFCFC